MVIVTQTLHGWRRAWRAAARGPAWGKNSGGINPERLQTSLRSWCQMYSFLLQGTHVLWQFWRLSDFSRQLKPSSYFSLSARLMLNYPVIATDRSLFTCDYDLGSLSSGDKKVWRLRLTMSRVVVPSPLRRTIAPGHLHAAALAATLAAFLWKVNADS